MESIVPLSVDHIESCPDIGSDCFAPSPPRPYWHHVREVVSESAFDASYAITSSFAIDTRWAVRVVDVKPTYTELDGAPKSVPNDIHHHDETLGGVTDPWLLARIVAGKGGLVSIARFGLSFPLGKTIPDPYELTREGKWHEHVQVGTGTFIPIVDFGLAYTIAPVTISFSGTGLFNWYANSKGYQAPTRLYFSHRVAVGFLHDVLKPFAEASLAHEGEEYWHGQIGAEGSNVRTEIYVGGGVGWQFYERWALEASASGRVASLTSAPTFASAGTFSVALTTSFDVAGKRPTSTNGSEKQISPHIVERRHDGIVEYEKD